jgi:hypothetical protein
MERPAQRRGERDRLEGPASVACAVWKLLAKGKNTDIGGDHRGRTGRSNGGRSCTKPAPLVRTDHDYAVPTREYIRVINRRYSFLDRDLRGFLRGARVKKER